MMNPGRYAHHKGHLCPHCRKRETIFGVGGVDTNLGTASQEVFCSACGAKWKDHYVLSHYSGITLPDTGSESDD